MAVHPSGPRFDNVERRVIGAKTVSAREWIGAPGAQQVHAVSPAGKRLSLERSAGDLHRGFHGVPHNALREVH